ncbi:translation initiation factor IF-2-like [Serinus canaria]|uniref:translation initiation factor IF-2-like n=1 Tax=Serinus canaria TaxID=9135 RepID=UPI0021CC4ECF|nr:translation initiation factor IF-2-like [Serinus canaria]
MARRKPGRGGGVGSQRNAPARSLSLLVQRGESRLHHSTHGQQQQQQEEETTTRSRPPPTPPPSPAKQRKRARSLRQEKESPPPPRPLLSPHGPARRPFPPRPPEPPALPGGGGQAGQEWGSRALLTPATAPLPRRPPALSGAGGERGASATRLLAGRRAGCGRRCRRGGREGGGRAAERRFLCAVPARGGIRRTGRRRGCGGGAAAARGGGCGGAGSSRVPAPQEWEASEAKMPPGSAALLGRPGTSTPPARGSPIAQPAPSEPAGDLGALPGALASAHQTCGTDESSAFQERWARGGVLSTRGPARDGDAGNLWLNWS